jgi:hypothetical protein
MESIKDRAPQRRQRIGLRARKNDLWLNVHRLEARARGAFWYGRGFSLARWPDPAAMRPVFYALLLPEEIAA